LLLQVILLQLEQVEQLNLFLHQEIVLQIQGLIQFLQEQQQSHRLEVLVEVILETQQMEDLAVVQQMMMVLLILQGE
tara:strand:+ start:83 stop:313 length:231 start_codon:yes stop_codon:yes gene_type:complete